MQKEDYTYNGERFVRVTKIKARKIYNDGNTVYLIPDMMRLDNAWQSPCSISKKDNGGDREFDARVNEFVYYNCDRVRGHGVKYFVKQSDYDER